MAIFGFLSSSPAEFEGLGLPSWLTEHSARSEDTATRDRSGSARALTEPVKTSQLPSTFPIALLGASSIQAIQ